MLKTITIDFETIEMMVYFWEAVASREKVVDSYMLEVAEKDAMSPLYNDEFTKESVRRVLSAIANRELVNNPTKAESRFWNNNMWMLEDLENMKNMLKPVKMLNLDAMKSEYAGDTKTEDIQISFVPGHVDTVYVNGNKLTVNFFRIIQDFENPSVMKIDGIEFKTYIENKVREML